MQTNRLVTQEVEVSSNPFPLEEGSDFANEIYAFGYEITIRNLGSRLVQLLNRKWKITDGNGEITIVEGDGVVGVQPEIEAGEAFVYQSWTRIKSPIGTMEGSYGMIYPYDLETFEVVIPPLSLLVAGKIH